MAEKIRILFLAANPVDVRSRLRLDKETRAIDKKLQAGSKRESFEVVSQWAASPSDLHEALLSYNPHIVHFSGHGSKNQGIILEDRDGDLKPVSKQALVRLFRIPKGHIRIVFLNACDSQRQVDGLREVIDFTIAMRSAIRDETAVVFASHFYQALALSRSVIEAFELAKCRLTLDGIAESKPPELFVRHGVDVSKAYLTLEDSGSFRSVKSPVKPGNVSFANVRMAVRKVANIRANEARSGTPEPHKSK